MKKGKKQFCPYIYAEWGELFDAITEKERSEILLAITKFPEYEPVNVPIWNFIKSQLQKDYELFVEKCNKNGEISRNYWQNKKTNDTERNRTDTERHPKLKHKLLTKTKTKTKTETKNINPSLEEIKQYCIERKNNVDYKRFYDYYNSANWEDSSGKPIKNWKQKMIAVWEPKVIKKEISSVEQMQEMYQYVN